jgi:hypothetical protein
MDELDPHRCEVTEAFAYYGSVEPTVADDWIALEVADESARRWFRKTKTGQSLPPRIK